MTISKDGWVHFEETTDLTPWQRPMQPIPDRVEAAIAAGVQTGPGPTIAEASQMLDLEQGGDGLRDAAVRLPDGTLLVACLTEMPGVTAQMWDWWFGWHSYCSERYQLWHPQAHQFSALAEDRRSEPDLRKRWQGNTSYVDEYIGTKLQRLAIRFLPPQELGLDTAAIDSIGVAICARTVLRRERLAAGYLIHLVENTESGCRMHSRFWLGNAASELPIVAPLVNGVANLPAVRRHLVSDSGGLDLLRHCSEEMNHLAASLPELFKTFASAPSGPSEQH